MAPRRPYTLDQFLSLSRKERRRVLKNHLVDLSPESLEELGIEIEDGKDSENLRRMKELSTRLEWILEAIDRPSLLWQILDRTIVVVLAAVNLALSRATFEIKPHSLPRAMDLLGYVFPRKFREAVYTPAVEDLKADYYESRKRYRTRGARWFLGFVFFFRSLLTLAFALRVAGVEKIIKPFLPEIVRRIWWGKL